MIYVIEKIFFRMSLLRQTLYDLDEFIQREGPEIEQQLLRSKLLLIHQILPKSRSKTIIRGILNRINRTNIDEILIKVLDLIKFQELKYNFTKSIRKLNLLRMISPIDIISIFAEKPFPLKLEY